MPKSIHIFRRDYRLDDNTALLAACESSDIVIPIFIFTHKQIDKSYNPYFSDNCVQFLCESLDDLNEQLHAHKSRLFIFYGNEDEIIHKLLSKDTDITSVFFNMDYTAYSQKRDAEVTKMIESMGRKVNILEDITLHKLGEVATTSGGVYTKYTPYYRNAVKKDVQKPVANHHNNYLSASHKFTGELDIKKIHKFYTRNEKLPHKGGRKEGLGILRRMSEWRDYDKLRNELDYETTRLSAFNKFGCISVREAFHAVKSKLGLNSGIIGQYIWRDFFYTLSHHHPEIYERSLNAKFRDVRWSTNTSHFNAWKAGRTGYPIVDACMQEINTTGYMHNRGRLIVSNFLVRMLHIDWREGERYFAQMLYDYDPAQNNFGWQISAFTSGTESRPVNQTIMNPWIQSHNFDSDASYIKKWLPQLKDIPAGDLHNWGEKHEKYKAKVDYPAPVVEYHKEKDVSLKAYGWK